MHGGDYFLAGLRVRADFVIRDLAPWQGEDTRPDIRIRVGHVPDGLDDLIFDESFFQVARDGSCRFAVPGTAAAYLVNADGTEVTVAGDPRDDSVRLFLLSAVFSTLCHKRNLLAIHASCVNTGGRAIAFAGPSASGKSVLAAAFLKAGHTIVADDVTVIDVAAQGGPMALPAFPRLRLWPDALKGLGIEHDRLERSRPGIEKYDLAVEHAFGTRPVPLAAVFHIQPDRNRAGDSCTRTQGGRALQEMAEVVYRARTCRALKGETALFLSVSQLCAAVPGWSLAYRPGFNALPSRVADIIADEMA